MELTVERIEPGYYAILLGKAPVGSISRYGATSWILTRSEEAHLGFRGGLFDIYGSLKESKEDLANNASVRRWLFGEGEETYCGFGLRQDGDSALVVINRHSEVGRIDRVTLDGGGSRIRADVLLTGESALYDDVREALEWTEGRYGAWLRPSLDIGQARQVWRCREHGCLDEREYDPSGLPDRWGGWCNCTLTDMPDDRYEFFHLVIQPGEGQAAFTVNAG